MLAAQPDIDTLVVAVGGGGLISGMATAARALRPGIQVFGVQTERFAPVWSARMAQSRECGQATIADGIAVKSPGALTLPLILRACRRRAAGRRRRHRAGHPAAAGNREDGGRRCGRRRPGGAAQAARALRRPQGRSGAERRQHRAAGACRDHPARHGQVGPAGAAALRRARRARLAGRRGGGNWVGSARTSTRCSTSAHSPRCRSSVHRSMWWCRPAALPM